MYTKLLIRCESLIFYFLLFAIPIHTRKIIWHQDWFFNEWQAMFIYGTDILIIILFIFWWKNNNNFQFRIPRLTRDKFFNLQKYDYFLILFLLVGFFSLANTNNHSLAWYQLVKLAEFVLFYFYLKSYALKKFDFSASLMAIVAGGVLQSVVVIVQFVQQSSLGLKYLGESVLSRDMSGVAVFFNTHGEKILRAYGTTPHPNVVATYIFLAIFALYFLWVYRHWPIWKGVLLYSLMLVGLFLTFSRTVVLLFGLGLIIGFVVGIFVYKFRKKILTSIFLTTIIVFLVFLLVMWPEVSSRIRISGDEEAVQLRLFYDREIIQGSPNWLGHGIGNFIPWLQQSSPNLARSLYQPVHNIYLLIYAEMGVLGITSFVLFLFFLLLSFIRRTKIAHLHHFSLLILFLSFLAMGLVDHFLWSLQEGRLMLWLMIALMTSDNISIASSQ